MKLLTRDQAKQALGDMHERTFALWVRKGLPRKGDGRAARYPWPEIQRWVVEHARQEGRESVRPKDYEDAKARKMMAEAELAEYDVALKRRELMSVGDAEKTLSEAFDRIRGQLLALPSRLAHDFVGIQTLPEANARLTRAVSDVMEELSGGTDVPVEEESDELDDEAAEV